MEWFTNLKNYLIFALGTSSQASLRSIVPGLSTDPHWQFLGLLEYQQAVGKQQLWGQQSIQLQRMSPERVCITMNTADYLCAAKLCGALPI